MMYGFGFFHDCGLGILVVSYSFRKVKVRGFPMEGPLLSCCNFSGRVLFELSVSIKT